MEWHRERAEAWDRLATQVVAFSGVIIALTPNVFELVRSVNTSLYRHAFAIAIVVSIGLLIASSITALFSLSRPLRTKVQTELMQQEWQRYRDQKSSYATFATEVVQTLIGDPGERAAIIELRNGADQRQTLTRFAVTGLAAGIILMAIVLSIRILST
jgi:hypothetical protein